MAQRPPLQKPEQQSEFIMHALLADVQPPPLTDAHWLLTQLPVQQVLPATGQVAPIERQAAVPQVPLTQAPLQQSVLPMHGAVAGEHVVVLEAQVCALRSQRPEQQAEPFVQTAPNAPHITPPELLPLAALPLDAPELAPLAPLPALPLPALPLVAPELAPLAPEPAPLELPEPPDPLEPPPSSPEPLDASSIEPTPSVIDPSSGLAPSACDPSSVEEGPSLFVVVSPTLPPGPSWLPPGPPSPITLPSPGAITSFEAPHAASAPANNRMDQRPTCPVITTPPVYR
jgi:hypothetical protein